MNSAPVEKFVSLACALGIAVFVGAAQSQAQSQAPSVELYPAKQIKLMVPFTPGSGVDTMARLVAEKLPATLGGTAFVDNRPGASGTIGTAAVAKAAPDGLTLMVSATTHVIAAAGRKLSYHPITDFAPIAEFARGSFLVVVPANSPAKSLADLVQQLKASKELGTYSSAGSASTVHLFTETMLQAAQTKALHIPSKGVTGAILDAIQAQVDFTIAPASLAVPHLKSGKLRALAQTASTRSKLVPDVPTVGESGYPGFEASVWIGLYAPAGTPSAIVAKLNRSVNDMLARPDVLQALELNGMEPVGGSAEQFLTRNKSDFARFNAIVKSANITAD